jgi:hypothetical protein
MKPDESTNEFDAAFRIVPELTWLPWVGQHFAGRPLDKRLLVVGESHYYNGETPHERQTNREKWLVYPQYTREVVSESLVNNDWSTRTLDTIPKVLLKTGNFDPVNLWGACSYYNFVQRMMDYMKEGGPERPSWEDYLKGWNVFSQVVSIIQPSHCFFIGVTAANSFNQWITSQNTFAGSITSTRKIGGTWARAATVEVAGRKISLIFVKHLGLPLSWSEWHDYLQVQHPDLMNWLGAEGFAISQK